MSGPTVWVGKESDRPDGRDLPGQRLVTSVSPNVLYSPLSTITGAEQGATCYIFSICTGGPESRFSCCQCKRRRRGALGGGVCGVCGAHENRENGPRSSRTRGAKFEKIHALSLPFTREQRYGVQGVAGSNPAVPTSSSDCPGSGSAAEAFHAREFQPPSCNASQISLPMLRERDKVELGTTCGFSPVSPDDAVGGRGFSPSRTRRNPHEPPRARWLMRRPRGRRRLARAAVIAIFPCPRHVLKSASSSARASSSEWTTT